MVRTVALCLWVLACGLSADAQEFRVYTRVYDERPGKSSGRNEPVARSTTVFHAGRVYDYLDSLGEMTVFEPAHERFTIVRSSRMLCTELSYGEIETVLHQSARRAEAYLTKSSGDRSLEVRKVAAPVRFHLSPQFVESLDPSRQKLRLHHDLMSYEVRCTEGADPEAVTAYLRYADWTARLNYLLHPQTLLPGPRLALNEALRKEGLLPVEVRLESRFGGNPVRRAEHTYAWKLDASDRRMIRHWEQLLASPEMKRVPFDTFQEVVVGSELAKSD